LPAKDVFCGILIFPFPLNHSPYSLCEGIKPVFTSSRMSALRVLHAVCLLCFYFVSYVCYALLHAVCLLCFYFNQYVSSACNSCRMSALLLLQCRMSALLLLHAVCRSTFTSCRMSTLLLIHAVCLLCVHTSCRMSALLVLHAVFLLCLYFMSALPGMFIA
jgi:hypothetical protein